MPFLIRKDVAGAAPHGYVWESDGAIIEVSDEHAALVEDLLRQPGFSEVAAPAKVAVSTDAAASVDAFAALKAPTRKARR